MHLQNVLLSPMTEQCKSSFFISLLLILDQIFFVCLNLLCYVWHETTISGNNTEDKADST